MDELFPYTSDERQDKGPTYSFSFRIDDRSAFDEWTGFFESCFGAEDLKDYLQSVQPKLLGCSRITVEGSVVDAGIYMPVKKSYAYRKRDAAVFCALVHCHPDNLRQVLSLFPDWYSKALRLSLLNGYVSQTELSSIGAQSMIVSREDHYSWQPFKPGQYCSLFDVVSSLPDRETEPSYWDREGYLFIHRYLQSVYTQVLLPDYCIAEHYIQQEATWPVLWSEAAFHQALPLIQGLQRQQQIPVTAKLKISAAAAKKLQSSMPEVVPEAFREIMKVSTGQYFLPGLLWAMQKKRQGAEEYAKAALSRLMHAGPEQVYPAFLPHIKGFRANQFRYVPDVFWMDKLCAYLEANPSSWISLTGLSDHLHLTGECGYTFRADLLRELLLRNTVTGRLIRPNMQGREIDLEILRAMAVNLYGWGMADLAIDSSGEIPDSPLGNVMQVRLTGLGRYVLGLEKTYSPPKGDHEGRFVLDEQRLIIHSIGKDNPYERLLLDTAEPIGRGKYRMSSESFLKHCKSAGDVAEKVKFFEDYIDGNPPAVWRDFFASIRRRSKPLVKVKEDYYLLKLDAKDTELIDLMTSTPAIRRLIILAEGYLFLVRKEDYSTLVQLLKQHSYLL